MEVVIALDYDSFGLIIPINITYINVNGKICNLKVTLVVR